MTIRYRLLPALLLCVIPLLLPAQGPAPLPLLPAEARTRVETGLASSYESEKLAALDDLSKGHETKIFSDIDVLRILEGVLILGSSDTDYNNPLLVSLAPVRIKALTVLERIKTREAQLLLLRVCESEIDDVVVEQAMLVARNLSSAPSLDLINAMVRILRDPYPQAPHDKLMLETMKTIGVLHQKFGNMAKRPLYDAIINLSEHPRYLQVTRKTAQNLIRQLGANR